MKLKKLLVAVVAASLVTAFILPTRAADNPAATVTEENRPEVVAEEEAPEVVVDMTDDSEGTITTDTTDVLSETSKEATENTLPEIKETETTEEVSIPAAEPVLRNQPVRGPADENIIPDEALKREINRTLKRPDDTPISKEDLSKLTYLSITDVPVKSLAGLEHATNLEHLSLMEVQVTDLSGIPNTPSLKTLSLRYMPPVKDWSLIKNMTQLESLTIGETYDFSDVNLISTLTNLKYLYLSGNRIQDITPIANLTQLEFLSLTSNRISDVTPLKNLRHLKTLTLHSNRIADFSSLPPVAETLYLKYQEVYVSAHDGKAQNPFVNPDGTKDFSVESTTNVTVSGNEFTLTDPSRRGYVSLKSNMPGLEFTPELIIDSDGSYTITMKYGSASRHFAEPGTEIYIGLDDDDLVPHGKAFKFWKAISGNITFLDPTSRDTSFIMPNEDVEIGIEFDQSMAESFKWTLPEEKLCVQDIYKLTKEEQDAFVKLIKDTNPTLPTGTEIRLIDPEGTPYIIVFFPDGSRKIINNQDFLRTLTEVSVQNGEGSGFYKPATTIDITANAAPEGKTFDQWVLVIGDATIADVNAPATKVTLGTKNATIQATYTDVTYHLTVQDGFGSGDYAQDAVVDITANEPGKGKVFDKWVLVSGNASIADVNAPATKVTLGTEDATVKATYTDVTYHLSIQAGSGSGDYAQDAVVDIAANAAPEGKTFDKWVLVSGNATIADVNAPATKVTMGTEDATIKATYTDVTYHLSIQAGQGSGDYVQDAVVDITANAAPEGKVFDQWVLVSGNATIADVNAAATKVTMGTEDATVQATYKDITYKLTIQAGQGSGDYVQDAVVDITANEAPEGKVFDQWVLVNGDATIDDVNAAATKVTMGTEDATIQATYTDVTYHLSIQAGQGSGDYVQDAVVDITADEAPEGKVFDQWVLVNGDATIDDVNAAATKVTMGTQDATIQATYKDAPKPPVDDPNDDNKPGDNKPGDNKPGDNKPGDNKPGDNKPGDNNKPGKTPTGATGVKHPMPSTGIPGETLTLLTMISLLGGAYAGRKFGHGKK